MKMTLEECKRRFPNHPKPAPKEYAGKWVAWDSERSEIVASGEDFAEVHEKAVAAGHGDPIMQRVISQPFVGMGSSGK